MRRGVLLCCSVLLGCSGPKTQPDTDSWPAPPVVSAAALEADTIPVFPATESNAGGEQPEVLFRCEEGKLGAYLVPSASAEGELAGERVVPIVLDSAPSC